MSIIATLFLLQWVNISAYREVMLKAKSYLEHHKSDLDAPSVLLLHSLNKYYGMNIRLGDAPARVVKKMPVKMRSLLRELDPTQVLTELEIRTFKGVQGLFATALYCDIYPLPWNYSETVRRYAGQKPYNSAQGLKALAILRQKKCKYDESRYDALRSELTAGLPAALRETQIGDDFWLEYVGALYLSGKGHNVPVESLKTLVSAQLPDGSWGKNLLRTAKTLQVLVLASEFDSSLRR